MILSRIYLFYFYLSSTMKNFMLKMLAVVCLLPSCFQVEAQETDVQSVMKVTGIVSEEQMDEGLLETYEALLLRKVKLNMASESRLVSCGLFSRYQVVAFLDYRKRYGDVLSFAELSLVDGFGEAFVNSIMPFVSLDSSAKVSHSSRSSLDLGVETLARASAKVSQGDPELGYASKLRVGDPDRFMVSAAAKAPYSAQLSAPDTYSASVAYHGRRRLGKLILGDFNARFGQGLVQWSGFSLSGFSTAASFAKHPTGLSQAWTISPSMSRRGVAMEILFGRISVNSFADIAGTYGGNVCYYGRRGQVGANMLSEGIASSDFRLSLGKWDGFGEIAVQHIAHRPAYVLGLTFNPEYLVRASILYRDYPSDYSSPYAGAARSSTKSSDEKGLAAAFDFKSFTISADAAFHPSKLSHQYKCSLVWNPQVSDFLQLRSKLAFRLRPEDSCPLKEDMRTEARYCSANGLCMNISASLCHCEQLAWATYLEGGLKKEKRYSFFLRATLFDVKTWNDRIYIYDRDLKGAFSVPSYYGSGYALASIATVRTRHFSIGMKGSLLDYPFMKEEKPGKAELKIQVEATW